MDAHMWNEEVRKCAPSFGAFLQMEEWGRVQELLGYKVKRVRKNTPEGTVLAQGIWQPLPLGASYWFFPKGPLGDAPQEVRMRVLREEFPSGAFFKIESEAMPPGARPAAERHPAHTSILSLEEGVDAVYAGMKQKTRYNIRLAQKKGVQVEYAGIEGLARFVALMEETAARDGFHAHGPDRYAAIVQAFQGPHARAFFAFATLHGKDLAANLMIDAYDTRTYLHGASSNTERDVMAPYALHATLIEDAWGTGMKHYDFWGIAPPRASANHPWAGITRFKEGFGGTRVAMSGTWDIPCNMFAYTTYRLARRIRGLK